ncbi:MAG: 50S ribosomal protein L29 [Acidimicrobiaceae bacterium]|jgi:large subunit ribosomal protein L29|nr:50S ribosomal protein L29 [Acidimicrobiaceae bacterium]MBT6444461.1 50S ribosomal protein L29 [Acidimicrobiaceae bacterium]MCH9805418.1 50S ribosomal protein L29 [bacterium]MCO4832991.1 50S ribosomal protein L29 [Acidimicrobiaceae bacterium]HAY69339.1 50S ribosomal protein L29 [Acidimicrobiaceae bacterium]
MAKNQNLTELSDTDLINLLDETKDESLNLRFQHVTGQLDNFKRIGTVRKQVARIKTELRMREINAAEAEANS